MAQQQLSDLRQKLQAQQRQFQNYRDQSRNLQAFLQQQSQKKQAQIRKLKEQSINKQKLFKNIKIQNNQLQNQIVGLKLQVQKIEMEMAAIKQQETKSIIIQDPSKYVAQIQNKNNQIKNLQNQIQILNKQLQNKIYQLNLQQQHKRKRITIQEQLKQKIISLQQQIQILKKSYSKKDNDEVLQKNKKIIQQLKNSMKELKKQLKIKQKVIVKLQETIKKNMQIIPSPKKQRRQVQISGLKMTDSKISKEIMQERINQLEDKIQRYEKIIKNLKQKQKQKQRQKTQQNGLQSPIKHKRRQQQQSPQKSSPSPFLSLRHYIGCIIVTKPHYQSPILQIIQETNSIKLFKSSRNGCFQRSLGASKHKMDIIVYDHKAIVQDITNKIINYQTETSHLIIIYGVKRSNKKTVMAAILIKLFNYLKNKLENQQLIQLQSTYIKKKGQNQNQFIRQDANSVDQVLDLLQKATICNQQQGLKNMDKVINKKGQKGEKARITYFSLRVNQFFIEIATSSYTGIPYRQKQIINTFLNNILYSRLPNILQNSHSQKYLIITLNPIVDLYEECKNTLNITQYKPSLSLSLKQQIQLQGLNKQHLNQMAKKRLQLYQKQIQQNLIKIKKIEDECYYFKSKFDELQARLKTLLSTHHAQNSYLKKSPILLSYEKMLKFVHAVQTKNTNLKDSALTWKFNNVQSSQYITEEKINHHQIDFDFDIDDDQLDQVL